MQFCLHGDLVFHNFVGHYLRYKINAVLVNIIFHLLWLIYYKLILLIVNFDVV